MPAESMTQKASKLVILACSLSLLSSLGCAAAHQGIPTGQWSGQGSYVDYEAVYKGKPGDVVQSRSLEGAYETSLKIAREEMYGREVLVFDVRSLRGKLMNVDGTETHLRFVLAPLETLDRGSQLYACVGFEFNPKNDISISKERFEEQLRFASASSILQNGATVLQIDYMIPTKGSPPSFVDTFVFSGYQAHKRGRYIMATTIEDKDMPKEHKLITVYWAETLRKVE